MTSVAPAATRPSSPGSRSGQPASADEKGLSLAEQKVLALLCKPLAIGKVCDISTWPRRKVEELARRQGLRINHAGLAIHPDGPAALAEVEAAATHAAYSLAAPHAGSRRPARLAARARPVETARVPSGGVTRTAQPKAADTVLEPAAARVSDGATATSKGADGPSSVPNRPDREEALQRAPIGDLLAAADEFTESHVTSAAARVYAAVDVLRRRLIEAEQARAQAEQTTRARREAAAEVDRLRAELAAAEQRARELGIKRPRRRTRTAEDASASPERTTRTKPRGTTRRFWPGSDYNPRTVREWARANGHQVPTVGAYLPDDVVEAALAAGYGKATA